jgi:hypothetical protein
MMANHVTMEGMLVAGEAATVRAAASSLPCMSITSVLAVPGRCPGG